MYIFQFQKLNEAPTVRFAHSAASCGVLNPERNKYKEKSAGEGIRTLELLQDWVLSPAPLTRLGNPCTKTWRYNKMLPPGFRKPEHLWHRSLYSGANLKCKDNAPAGIFRDGTFAQILIIKIIYFRLKDGM